MTVSISPGMLCPWFPQQLFDTNGDPLVGGKVYFYTAGTSDPLPVYTNPLLTEEHPHPIVLDAYGFPPDARIWIAAASYKVAVYDADDVLQYTVDGVQNSGQLFSVNFGLVQQTGSKDVVSDYEITALDRFVTVNSTGGADPCVIYLPSISVATQQLTVKNLGTIAIALTPNGVETIEGLASAYTIPAAASPNFPAVTLLPDGVSGWLISGSHGL